MLLQRVQEGKVHRGHVHPWLQHHSHQPYTHMLQTINDT